MPDMSRAGEFHVVAETGLIEPARFVVSPNCDLREAGQEPELLLLHGISLPPGEFGGDQIEALFTNSLDWNAHPYFEQIRGLQVSTHLLVRRDGSVLQFVPFTQRAWHAGESEFRGRPRCNDYSIGIELEGEDTIPYDERQYAVLPGIIRAIASAYPRITMREIAAHSDVAPGRKTDPGPAFDWLRLYDALEPES